MPQMLAIQPNVPQGTPQATPSGSPGNKEQSQFSPHLDKAISGQRQHQQKAQDKSGQGKPSESDRDTSRDANSQTIDSLKSLDKSLLPHAAEEQQLTDILKQNPDQTSLPLVAQEKIPALPDSFLAQLQQGQSVADELNSIPADIAAGADKFGKSPGSPANQPELSAGLSEPVVMDKMTPATAGKQDALINQLQSILDTANATGAVSITKGASPATSNPLAKNFYGPITAALSKQSTAVIAPATTQTAQLNQNGLLIAEGDAITIVTGKPTQQLTGIRYDSQQQYFNARITPQTPADNQQNFQDNQPGDEFSQQAAGSTIANSPFSAAEQTNTFSPISTIAQETAVQSTAEPAKPIYLPSGTIIHEQEILQQLTERLQLSSKHLDSRIYLKLHPAELGELKIDLTLKEGSIRANIVAQSQHTLEILEKNLPKLKHILESQGFDIEQISLTVESESVSDFDFFERQLFSNNDYTPTAQQEQREDGAVFTLDNIALPPPTANSGVNVKV